MSNVMRDTLEDMVRASRRNVGIWQAKTVAELMLAIEGTYYDIYLIDEPMEKAWSYFDLVDGKIMGRVMVNAPDATEEELAQSIYNRPMQAGDDKEQIDGSTPIKVICYPEDTVVAVFDYE